MCGVQCSTERLVVIVVSRTPLDTLITAAYSRCRKLLDILESRFDTEYVLNQQCTVDEAMIPFKGRLGFKQYMRQASEVGYKGLGFSRCKKNGYVKNLQIPYFLDYSAPLFSSRPRIDRALCPVLRVILRALK